jgi:osmoprotectant transport system ATP-binding protein
MNTIVLEGVSKKFPNMSYPAVDKVSLDIQAGELVVILGPSGCGKTTLLKMVNQLYKPTEGRVLIQGVDIRTIPSTRLRRGIGYVIQHIGLFPHLNIARNIATVPELLGWDRPRIDHRIDELLDLVGLPLSYRQRYPYQLSGGEQQRVGLARALAANPDILLMDEPFASLDSITRSCLQEELLKIQQKLRKTILFVTHDVEEGLRLADRLLILHKGKVVQYGAPLEVVAMPANDFVHELLGSGDALRRLSLMDVSTLLYLQDSPPTSSDHIDPAPTILLEEDLRSALVSLLRSGSLILTVLNSEGQPIGQIGFADLRRALVA